MKHKQVQHVLEHFDTWHNVKKILSRFLEKNFSSVIMTCTQPYKSLIQTHFLLKIIWQWNKSSFDSEKCHWQWKMSLDSEKCHLTVKNVTDSEKCQLTVKIVTCAHFSLSKIDSENRTPRYTPSVKNEQR